MNAQVLELRHLLRKNGSLQPLFTFFAKKGASADQTVTVETMITVTQQKIDRKDLVHVCKFFDRIGLGNFVPGRRGTPSRTLFYFSLASIGIAALGGTSKLVKIQPISSAVHSSVSLPFQMKHTSAGTMFLIPQNANNSDVTKLLAQIRKTFIGGNKTMTA